MVKSLFAPSVPQNLDFNSATMVNAVPLCSLGYHQSDASQQRQVVWKHDAMDNTSHVSATMSPTQPPSPYASRSITTTGGNEDKLKRLKHKADKAVPFIERVAFQRAGGLEARARTVALCGYGTAAYSMIGKDANEWMRFVLHRYID